MILKWSDDNGSFIKDADLSLAECRYPICYTKLKSNQLKLITPVL